MHQNLVADGLRLRDPGARACLATLVAALLHLLYYTWLVSRAVASAAFFSYLRLSSSCYLNLSTGSISISEIFLIYWHILKVVFLRFGAVKSGKRCLLHTFFSPFDYD